MPNREGHLRFVWSAEDLANYDMSWVPTMSEYDAQTFLINAVVKDSSWSLWVVIMGDKETAEKYAVKMSIRGLGDPSVAVLHWGDVYSIEVGVKDILEDWKDVLELNKNMVRKLGRVRADGTQNITVEYEFWRK